MDTKTRVTLLAATAMLATVMLAASMITSAQAASDGKLQSLIIGDATSLANCANQHGGKEGCRQFMNRLDRISLGYQLYAVVDYCHQVREGYLVTYVNDVEMRRAKQAIKSIVDQVKSEDSSITVTTTDMLWNFALKATDGWAITRSMCQDAYLPALLDASFVNPVQVHKPN